MRRKVRKGGSNQFCVKRQRPYNSTGPMLFKGGRKGQVEYKRSVRGHIGKAAKGQMKIFLKAKGMGGGYLGVLLPAS